jgi:hypothetical protein
MSFGQASGPPAPAKLVQELLTLLHEAGHSDFRDARGPMGFNQRQAAGKFTREEATAYIEQLQLEAEAGSDASAAPPARVATTPPAPTARPAAAARPKQRASAVERSLEKVPTETLAAELQRRGWVVLEP